MDFSDEKKDRLLEVLGWWVNEFRTQTGHMTIIFSMIICLFVEAPQKALIWAGVFLLYYVILGITGKSTFELVWDCENESMYNAKKKMFKRVYLISTLALFIVGAITTGIFEAFIITIVVGTITFLYYLFDVDSNISTAYEIDFRENNKPMNNFIKLRKFSDEHPIIYDGIYYLSMLLMIVLPTLFLPVYWWVKVIIVIAYLGCIPFISLMADSGVDITTIFDFQDY